MALPLTSTGMVHLPAGVTEISSEIRLPDGAHDLTITGDGHSILHAASNFHGRAIFSCKGCHRIHFTNFSIDGNRAGAGTADASAAHRQELRELLSPTTAF